MLSNEEQEKFIRESVREVLDKKTASKPLLKKFARLFSDNHSDAIHDEIGKILSKVTPANFHAFMCKVQELETFSNVNYTLVADILMKRPDIFSLNTREMSSILSYAEDDRFVSYWEMAVNKGAIEKLISEMDHSTIKRISELKNLKNNPLLIKAAETFVRSRKGEAKSLSAIQNMLPTYGMLANHTQYMKEQFEEQYLFYLEHKKVTSKWETRDYVSALCRGLRNYKDKDFRLVLIRKLVLIQEPILQKRMAREFSKSRRYLNMA